MQLVGLLDSPFVRRVAISMLALRIPFEHRAVSVFRGMDLFRSINPVVKAPTLVAEDGTTLMDSSLILQYVEAAWPGRSLLPTRPDALLQALGIIGLSLAGCEKTAQIVYERGLRPPEKQHAPWIDRVTEQLQAAYRELEARVAATAWDSTSCSALGQAGISAAVAWHFTQQMLPELVPAAQHPALAGLSALAERLPEFAAAPHGEGLVAHGGGLAREAGT
jgi:glutathione S-transferase